MPALATILALLAGVADAHEVPAYRLPGDPDTMVRRGPEVAPVASPADASVGSRAVRVEDMSSSVARPLPEARLTVTREIIVPSRRVFHPDPRWQLRIRREHGEWSGDLVIGQPGWGWRAPHLSWPAPETPGSGRAALPPGG